MMRWRMYYVGEMQQNITGFIFTGIIELKIVSTSTYYHDNKYIIQNKKLQYTMHTHKHQQLKMQ